MESQEAYDLTLGRMLDEVRTSFENSDFVNSDNVLGERLTCHLNFVRIGMLTRVSFGGKQGDIAQMMDDALNMPGFHAIEQYRRTHLSKPSEAMTYTIPGWKKELLSELIGNMNRMQQAKDRTLDEPMLMTIRTMMWDVVEALERARHLSNCCMDLINDHDKRTSHPG